MASIRRSRLVLVRLSTIVEDVGIVDDVGWVVVGANVVEVVDVAVVDVVVDASGTV
jgi:hypothetical protein